ncbi:MAG: NAD(+)/NADH kinase [Clostridiales bacterium]|jgi:NAD+ kinase|nr:NAD(+)/NADH kinase [Clostridiales bacterium]
MKVVLNCNPHKDTGNTVSQTVSKLLKKYKIKFDCIFDSSAITKSRDDGDCFLITLGGDGTILNSVENCLKFDMPILGINIGNLGFLTEVELHQVDTAIFQLSQGKFWFESRNLVQLDLQDRQFMALNEVVIFRNTSHLIRVELSISDNVIDDYRGDGLIVSTPTGSTAYSLSAGGSVVSPDSPVFALTPINAHSLRSRPLIVGDNNIINLQLKSDATADIFVDGKECAKIDSQSKLTLFKSKTQIRFVRLEGGDNFYKKLAMKLRKP